MKTKIGMSFGLAMMLAVGVFATLLALGTFTPSEVQAAHDGTTVGGPVPGADCDSISPKQEGDDPNTAALEDNKINLDTDELYQVDDDVNHDGLTCPLAEVSPNEPGAIAKYTITFTTPSALIPGVDEIILEFEDDVGVPAVIDPSTVTIIADKTTSRAEGVTGSAVANPISVTTEKIGQPADETLVTILIPDMAPGEDGTQGIAASEGTSLSTITVIFAQTAGLTNPTEGTSDYEIRVSTSQNKNTIRSNGVDIPRELILSDKDNNRGKTITATGRGFENGTTATVWLDENQDGKRDTDETVLGTATVAGDDTFVVSFVINVPPFERGVKNHIRAIDGQTNKDEGDADQKISTFFVDGLMTITPKEAAIGDRVTVTLKDWPNDEPITSFDIGGVPIPFGNVNIVNGEDTFTFEVPDGVTLGVQEVDIDSASESDQVDMTILGAGLDISPGFVVPNQTTTIQGRGFTDNKAGIILASISIGGVNIEAENIDEGDDVTIDSSGNWVASVVIPINSVTTEPGTYDLKAFDSEGREGLSQITLEGRQIMADPTTSRAGTDINVSGTGYPAVNSVSPDDISITVEYAGAGFSRRTVTTTPDSSGSFNVTIGVPLGAGIPSTNTITVRYDYNDGNTTVTNTLSHRVPGAEISIDPVSGTAGTLVTVTGSGFKGTRQVSDLKIGNVDVRNVPVPSTDREGNFTTTFIVPQIETGAQSVKAEVGGDTSGTTASASFTVLKEQTGATTGPSSAPQDTAAAFASIIDNGDNLVRAFRFNNETQGWAFFDPRPAFASANDLTTVAGGDILWVRVNTAQDFNGLSLFAGWNLIVMP
jgi:hypothetical protein